MAETSAHQPIGRRPAPTVADRLRGARRRRFRRARGEVELVRGALAAAEPPFSVLWVHGPGGVGKTALLAALAEAAEAMGARPTRLDLRAIEPSPPAFAAEKLARALGLPAGASPWEALTGRGRSVLLLDTFEDAVAMEDWLREELVPSLPAGGLTVIAGRGRPAEAWRRIRDGTTCCGWSRRCATSAPTTRGPSCAQPGWRRTCTGRSSG